jgi:ABC-type protease/lipase transport system fused ATPase/permease subunit
LEDSAIGGKARATMSKEQEATYDLKSEIIVSDALFPSSLQGVSKSLSSEQHILTFQNLHVTIPKTGRPSNQEKTPPHKQSIIRRLWTPFAVLQGPSERVAILQGVSGQLRGGDLTAILGPSGAGKTTLLDALVGQGGGRSRGRVLLNGEEFDESFRNVTGRLFQCGFFKISRRLLSNLADRLTYSGKIEQPLCNIFNWVRFHNIVSIPGRSKE